MRIPLKIKANLKKIDQKQVYNGDPKQSKIKMPLNKKVPHIFKTRLDATQSVVEDFSEKTVASPNYKPPIGLKLEKRKSISFNSPHNLGGKLLHFIFPSGDPE